MISREIARRICRQYFRPDSKDFDQVRQLFGHISALIKRELDDDTMTPELKACIKVHIWRYIRYNTKIAFDERTARESIHST